MYTIGQVSEMFGLPVSTLRFYDKEGLFPKLKRVSGIRQFSDAEIERLRIIECLKRSGLEIRDIRTFMDWCEAGSETYALRYGLFLKQKEAVEAEMRELERVLSMIKFKCWYYEQALKDGNEERLHAMLPDNLPEEAQRLYNEGHGIPAARAESGEQSVAPTA